MPDTTRVLLDRWQGGDRKALEELVARHMEFLLRRVRQRIGQRIRARDESRDVVQEVAIEALQCVPRFKIASDDAFRRLLAQMVENTLRDRGEFWRAARRDLARQRPLPDDTVLDLDAPGSTSGEAARREGIERVRFALEFLNSGDREAILRRDYQRESFLEIGRGLGISEEAARKRHARAIVRLAKRLRALQTKRIDDLLTYSDLENENETVK